MPSRQRYSEVSGYYALSLPFHATRNQKFAEALTLLKILKSNCQCPEFLSALAPRIRKGHKRPRMYNDLNLLNPIEFHTSAVQLQYLRNTVRSIKPLMHLLSSVIYDESYYWNGCYQ